MSNVPAEFKYTDSHEWLETLPDGTVRVGITDHAQELLGDMVYVELPEVGRTLAAKEECSVVESVKAASDVYSPIGGEVVSVNENLNDSPELINSSPYEDGWIMTIKPADASEINSLLSAADYSEVAASDEH